MKLLLDGTLEGSPEELAAYKHIDAALAAKNKPKSKPKPKPKEVKAEVVEVSPQLSETLDWLIDNDYPGGVYVREVAIKLDIKPATATYRLNQLAKLGLVYKTKRGFYRAGEES